MPIYFGYPKQEKYNINLEIPEGYASRIYSEINENCYRRQM